MSPTFAGVGISIAFALLTACSTTWYTEDADAEVSALLDTTTEKVLGDRESWVIPTKPREEPPPEEEGEQGEAEGEKKDGEEKDEAAAQPPVGLIGLEEALQTAVTFNRSYLDRRESLYLTGLGVTLTRFNFGPLLSASVNAAWAKDEGLRTFDNNTASFSASQILPTGGNLSLSGSMTERDWGKSASLALSQPLLRGLGYEVSHEALISAERGIIYSIRDFELFRQDFSINIARTFFSLVSQKQTLANDEADYQQALFDREKAEAFRQVDRNEEEDVFRARRRAIEAEDALIAARSRYQRALDDFKIDLGLETSAQIDVKDEEPVFEPVRIDLQSAILAARHNRLDVLTQRQQVEDAERSLRLARNGLLPDIDLNLSGSVNDAAGTDDESFLAGSASINVEIPLQRKAERNSYRSAEIRLEQSQRNFTLFLDRLELDIRDQVRQLDSVEQRIRLQEEQIRQQERAVTVSEIRYEQGLISNFEVLEARQSFIDAKNALINLKADHFISRLRLLRDLGLLFISDDGTWR